MNPHDHRWRVVSAALVLVASTIVPVLASSPASATTGTANLQGWGYNYYGYLGDGSTNNVAAPETLSQSYVTQVSAGSGVLALHNDGTVFGWGRNGEGQLGDGGTNYRELSPVQVKLPPVVQVSEGASSNDFGLALDGAGNVYSFGRNAEAELGRNTGGGADPNPALVSGLPTTITSISAGEMHSLARTSDGQVWAWGWNAFGQLGDHTKYATTYGTFQVPGLSNIVSVVAGGNDSYALDTSGHVWAWGWDYGGQGVAPAQVSGLPAIQSLSAGNDHALGIDASGNVWAWGSNQYGQVGDNGPTGWRSPVQLTGLTGVTSVSASTTFSFAVESDGSLWAWGSNWFSQLGDGGTSQQNLPEHITGVSGVGGVSSNGYATLAWGTLPTSSSTSHFVVLGDSFSSGEGVPGFTGASNSDGCHRSGQAYAEVLNQGSTGLSLTSFVACSGATSGQVISGMNGEPSQLSAITSGDNLVVLTIGGDDAGFTPFVQACVANNCDVGSTAYNTAEGHIQNDLPGNLSTLFAAIRAKVSSGTRVLIVGYPAILPIPEASWTCSGLTSNSRTSAKAVENDLDGAIEAAVISAGAPFEFVNADAVVDNLRVSPFAGHELCSDTPYFNGADSLHWGYSYHPNAAGQSAYATLIQNYLAGNPTPPGIG